MRHPSEGTLRRLLDEPAGVGLAEREHTVGCESCLRLLAAIERDADLVARSIGADDSGSPPDLDAAWSRLAAGTTGPPAAAPAPGRGDRGRLRLRRPLVAAVAVAAALAGAGTAAANDWLQIFRTEQIAPVALTTADLVSLPDLSSYGDLEVSGEDAVREVDDAATAEAETGLDVPEVASLPHGVDGEPTYQVGGRVSATFTFSADRAQRAAEDAGHSLPAPPPGLDGSRVRLVAGPGVATVWTQESGVPSLIVGRAVAPTAFSSGVPFEDVRDYLLSLPGLPEDVAAQLRTYSADGSTLPLPVPSEHVATSSADVNGSEATLLQTRDRALAAVVWVRDGLVTVVAGSLDDDEVLSVARGLR